VLKKEMPKVHKQKGSSTGTDSDSDDALVKNDAFMSQMRDKLETCSLSDNSSKQSDDYFQSYTFPPAEQNQLMFLRANTRQKQLLKSKIDWVN
jgi:hypothetical protein